MDLTNNIGRKTGNLNHLFLRELERLFRAKGLPITAEQFKMMSRLWCNDGKSQQIISDEVCRNRAATGRMLDVLEKRGLIERHPHPTDRRLNLIFLTKEGKRIESDAKDCVEKMIEKATKGIKQNDLDKLESQLDIMIKNME